MKIKKILLILVIILSVYGCSNVKSYSYDDIVNMISTKEKTANTHKKGYQYNVPRGLKVSNSGTNYAILTSGDATYYLYFDLISYFNKQEISIPTNPGIYFKLLNYDNKTGYVNIKLWENNQYLIEIMYNYAKIEVMVDESLINKTLINSINILKSIKYNDVVMESLLNDDDLNYTEEIFDLFGKVKDNSNILDYAQSNENNQDEFEIKDTDYVD